MRHIVSAAALLIGAFLVISTAASMLQRSATRDYQDNYTPPSVASSGFR